MIKFTNILACILACILCGGIASGMIDQDILKRNMEHWLWWPSIWFGMYAFINLQRKNYDS